MSADTEKQAAEIVYLGRRTLSAGKLGESWITLAALGERPDMPDLIEGKASLFQMSKGKGRRIIGGVYAGTVKLDAAGGLTSIAIGAYVRRIEAGTQIIAWSATDEAANQRKRQADLERRLADDDGIERELVNLRRAYQRTPPADRTAFELMVLKRLRNPKSLAHAAA